MERSLDLRKKARKELKKIKYKNGYYIKNKPTFLNLKKPKVTVVTPVYNAEDYLEKTIDSVINQSLGFENIEYILVDDGSTDNSREILLEYAYMYSNIIVVFLEKNTGTPAQPRNIGIEMSRAKYITFLDADDWLDKDGLKTLYEILEESGDDYVVGKTIKITSKGTEIVGEHESCKERRNISPYSIPHIFQHLGPRARLMKTEIIKENNIRFPEMKYAEDKQFFIDVLINCKTISTTSKVIYYLNRLDENNASLTKSTNIFQKMDANIKVINYVINKKLDVNVEKMILNRLYEFDCITRFFNRKHFFKSKDKQKYIDKFNEVLKTTRGLRYNFVENFFHPINKVAYEMFCEGEYDSIQKLFEWDRNEKDKNYIIKNNLPFMVTPFSKEKYKFIRVPMLAIFKGIKFYDKKVKIDVEVYGDYVDEINDVIFRDRSDVNKQFVIEPIRKENGKIEIEVDLDYLNNFPTSSFSIFIRYKEYNKVSISRINENKIEYENRIFDFYTTVNSNLGFRIKNAKF